MPLVDVHRHQGGGRIHHGVDGGENGPDDSGHDQADHAGAQRDHQLDQLGEGRIGGDGAVGQPGLKQVEGGHAGSDGEEGDQHLEEPGHDDPPARLQVAAGAQGPLRDELVGPPVEAVQGHQPGQHPRPGQLGVAGRQVEMHLAGPLPIQFHHGVPAADLSEGQYGQQYPRPQQQDRLNHVGPDDGLQPAPDGVAGRDRRQGDHEEGVVEGVHVELGSTGLGLFPAGCRTFPLGGET